MHPICFEIFGRPIFWYGVFVATGFLCAVLTWELLGRRDGRPKGFASEMGFWVMVSGLVGARLAYIVANLGHYMANPVEMIRFDRGGLIYYGGFFGGAIGLWLFARKRRLSLLALGDYAITGLVLGHVFGRIGCFLNGCCFGGVCRAGPSVVFPPNSPASIEHAYAGLIAHQGLPSLPVYPTQLYESAFNLLVYGLLVFVYLRRPPPGRVAALYLIVYPVGRFLLEFTRGDQRMAWLQLTVAQEVSIGLLAAGVVLWVVSNHRARKARA
jgi:phosphatidylglycerol:prolipoprotein diacylglycerol transferase